MSPERHPIDHAYHSDPLARLWGWFLEGPASGAPRGHYIRFRLYPRRMRDRYMAKANDRYRQRQEQQEQEPWTATVPGESKLIRQTKWYRDQQKRRAAARSGEGTNPVQDGGVRGYMERNICPTHGAEVARGRDVIFSMGCTDCRVLRDGAYKKALMDLHSPRRPAPLNRKRRYI